MTFLEAWCLGTGSRRHYQALFLLHFTSKEVFYRETNILSKTISSLQNSVLLAPGLASRFIGKQYY